MSQDIPNSFITKFEAEVSHEFQRTETLLRKTVKTVRGVGKDFRWTRFGTVEAQEDRPRYADLTPANVDIDTVSANIVDLEVAEYIKDFDPYKTNIDLRNELKSTLAAAINRKIDSKIITALAGYSTNLLSVSNAAGKTAFIAANKQLTLANVPHGNRYAVLSPGGEEDLLGDTTLVNRDYVNNELLNKGYVSGVVGFEVITHTGLPVVTGQTQKYNFWYPMGAVGLAIVDELKVQIERVPQKNSWQVLATASVGAVAIRPEVIFAAAIAD